MAIVSVSNWAEFLEAVAVAGDTVECPTDAEWDLTDADIIHTKIVIRCAVINGNGTTIKGQRFEITGGEYEHMISNANALEINDLHWESLYVEANNQWAARGFWDSGWGIESALTMNRCKVSAECSGNVGIRHFFSGTYHYFTSCAMNVSMLKGGDLIYGNSIDVGYSKFCRYQIYTTSSSSSPFNYSLSPFNYCEKCELTINAPNAQEIGFSLDSGTRKISGCVVRGSIGATQKYNCSADDYTKYQLTAISESTMAKKNDDHNPFQNGIICSDSELRSAAYLSSWEGYNHSVFPLGDGDEDWHVGDPEINGGYPYIPKMIDVPRLELHPVKQSPYITIYSITTPQNGFDKNGLAILEPTSCEVTEELNGAWTFTMQHPIDDSGKWEFIKLRNLVKIKGQLFTIMQIEHNYENNSGYITCTGEHIFYQLGDGWIFPEGSISGATAQEFMNTVKARTVDFGTHMGSMVYDFQGTSSMSIAGIVIKDVGDGCTPIDALIGSGGLIDQSESGYAELYRDNFNFSIEERMENAINGAFDIRVGRDLKGIKRTFDTSQFVSYFGCYDKWGDYFAVSWVPSDFITGLYFPHHIVRTKRFDGEEVDVQQFGFAPLAAKGMAFFRRNCKPLISYEIDLEDVRNNPDFEMMSAERLKVGDQGTLYDDRLGGNLTIKISGTVYDAVHDKVTHITIGDRASFSAPAASTVDVEPEVVGGELYIQDADGSFIADADDKLIYQEVTSDA